MKIRVIGVGGGGTNIVHQLAQSAGRVAFSSIDVKQGRARTSKRVSSVTVPLSFIESPEGGEGAEREKVQNMVREEDLLVFVASLGGKTTLSLLPQLAKEAKRRGQLAIGIFTMPFSFEGETKQEVAHETIARVKPFLNASCVLSNEKIFQTADSQQIPLAQALGTVNKNVHESLARLFETIFTPGIVNIDFADLKTTLRGHGKFGYLQSFKFQRAAQPQQILEAAMKDSLYPYTPERAQSMLFHIEGPEDISLSEVHEISKSMQQFLHPHARIIFGVSSRKDLKDALYVTFLVSGCRFHAGGESTPRKASKKKTSKKPVRKKSVAQKTVKPEKKPKPAKKKEPAAKKEVPKEKPKARKSALQVKKDLEETEKEIVEQEKLWDTPAFLRRPHP